MPTTYEHISFKFNKSSHCMDGTTFNVTAYLLVPETVMPELREWERVQAMKADDRLRSHLSPSQMFKKLKEQGALLHREDGHAYEEISKDMRGNTKIETQQYWEKGVEIDPADGPSVKILGKKYTL